MGRYSKFARCSAVVVEVFSKIMQELLATKVEATDLYYIVINHTNFKNRLSGDEIITIKTLMTDSFFKLNVTLIYKIIKFFNYIQLPKGNLIKNPLINAIEIGDDVERIRFARNCLAHRRDYNMHDREFQTFFKDFEQLGKRVDDHLRRSEDSGFQKEIEYFKTSQIDDIKEFEYIAVLKEPEYEKGRVYI